jgi:hypothetical protein
MGNHISPPPTTTRPWPQHSRLPARGGGRSPPPTTRLNIPHGVAQRRAPTHFYLLSTKFPSQAPVFQIPPPDRCGGIPLFEEEGVRIHEVRAGAVYKKIGFPHC